MQDKEASQPPSKAATDTRQSLLPTESWSKLDRKKPHMASAAEHARLIEFLGALSGFSEALGEKNTGRTVSAIDMLQGMAPRDPFEFQLAEMITAFHAATMVNMANAHDAGPGSPLGLAYQATARSMAAQHAEMLGAFNKHRGRHAQKYIVEHVHAVRGNEVVDMGEKNGPRRQRKSPSK